MKPKNPTDRELQSLSEKFPGRDRQWLRGRWRFETCFTNCLSVPFVNSQTRFTSRNETELDNSIRRMTELQQFKTKFKPSKVSAKLAVRILSPVRNGDLGISERVWEWGYSTARLPSDNSSVIIPDSSDIQI